jgi:hypothetical protein
MLSPQAMVSPQAGKLEEKIDPSERVRQSDGRHKPVRRLYERFNGILSPAPPAAVETLFLVFDRSCSHRVVLVFAFPGADPRTQCFPLLPFLRLLSHYRALRGAWAGLYSKELRFKEVASRAARM